MGLKVQLNVQEDAELRAAIKDMVRGSLTSIVRDEISDMVKEIMVPRIDKFDLKSQQFDKVLRSVVSDKLSQEGFATYSIRDAAKSIIDELIKDRIKKTFTEDNINALVKEAFEKHMRALISSVKV